MEMAGKKKVKLTKGDITIFSILTLTCLFLFFILIKLELLMQIPAPNDKKKFIFMKNRHLQFRIIGLTKHLLKTVLSNLVIFIDLNHACDYIYIYIWA